MGVMQDKTCLWVIGKEVFRLQTLPIGESDLARKIAAFRRLVLKIKDEGEETPERAGPEERDKLRGEMYSLLIPDPSGRPCPPATSCISSPRAHYIPCLSRPWKPRPPVSHSAIW